MKTSSFSTSLGLAAVLFFSHSLHADHRDSFPNYNSHDSDAKLATFYTYEASDLDYIAGVGLSLTMIDPSSKFGFGLTTSLSQAEVLTTDGFVEDYVAWEGTARLGYFSDVFAYMEVGIDLTELTFHDFRDDYDHFDGHSHHHHHDDVDSFIGFGAGVNFGKLKIEGFSRLRAIDSPYWEAEANWFSGVQLSINF